MPRKRPITDKLNRPAIKRICQHLREGDTRDTAALKAGIKPAAEQTWVEQAKTLENKQRGLTRHEQVILEYAHQAEIAEGKGELAAHQKLNYYIDRGMARQAHAQLRYMQRRYEDWRPKRRRKQEPNVTFVIVDQPPTTETPSEPADSPPPDLLPETPNEAA